MIITENVTYYDRILSTHHILFECSKYHAKTKIQNNFTGSPDVAETHRKCPELSKGN